MSHFDRWLYLLPLLFWFVWCPTGRWHINFNQLTWQLFWMNDCHTGWEIGALHWFTLIYPFIYSISRSWSPGLSGEQPYLQRNIQPPLAQEPLGVLSVSSSAHNPWVLQKAGAEKAKHQAGIELESNLDTWMLRHMNGAWKCKSHWLNVKERPVRDPFGKWPWKSKHPILGHLEKAITSKLTFLATDKPKCNMVLQHDIFPELGMN